MAVRPVEFGAKQNMPPVVVLVIDFIKYIAKLNWGNDINLLKNFM